MAAKNFKLATKEEGECNVQLFVGETIIARADVKRLNGMSSQEYGVAGKLFVTNFKIAFTFATDGDKINAKKHDSVVSLDKILSEEHCLLNDLIPLTSIYKIRAISTAKQKRKKVKSAKKVIAEHYDKIEIETKDFRVIQYDFNDSQSKDRRSCFQMISHYAYPTSVSRLFGFDYGVNMEKSNTDNSHGSGRAFCMFSHNKDYEMNLSRLQSSAQWRVSSVNSKFRICQTLPEFNVCPAALEGDDLIGIADCYVDSRFPIWSWNDPKTGVALLVSSRLRDGADYPKKLLDCISMCHHDVEVGSCVTEIFDSCSLCPNLKELKASFDQLRKAAVVHSSKEFWATDSTWLSDIESSRWLQHVATCLELSEKVARILKDDIHSVIVNDDSGRDFSLLIISLVQILLDPYYRTHVGLQALIQKDWVMGGHPFSRRLRNIYNPSQKLEEKDFYDGESPVFLLFLDSVQQLIHQHAMKFEYTEQFLILIADCAYSSLFQTFMFNCDSEHQNLRGNSSLISAWDFISVNMPLSKFSFRNPAYNIDENQPNSHTCTSSVDAYSGSAAGADFITPCSKLMDVKLWYNYFCRWFPSTSLSKGFSTNVILQLQQKRLMEEVTYLEERLIQLQHTAGVVSSDSVSTKSSSSSLGRQKHKRDNSKHDNKEDDYESFLSLMSDFYFLKLL